MISSIFRHRLRGFSFSTTTPISFVFIGRDGNRIPVTALPSQHLLQVAKLHNVELEGACEASLACSTCHVILPQDLYNTIDKPK